MTRGSIFFLVGALQACVGGTPDATPAPAQSVSVSFDDADVPGLPLYQDGDGPWLELPETGVIDVHDPDGRYALVTPCWEGPAALFATVVELPNATLGCGALTTDDPVIEVEIDGSQWPDDAGDYLSWGVGPVVPGSGVPFVDRSAAGIGWWTSPTRGGTWDILAAFAMDGGALPHSFAIERGVSIVASQTVDLPTDLQPAEPVQVELDAPGWSADPTALWLSDGGAGSVVPLGSSFEPAPGWSTPPAETIVSDDLQLPLIFGATADTQLQEGQPVSTWLDAVFAPRPLADRDVTLSLPPPAGLDDSEIEWPGVGCDGPPKLRWTHDDNAALYATRIVEGGFSSWSIRVTPARSRQDGGVALDGLEDHLDVPLADYDWPQLTAWTTLPDGPQPSLSDLLALSAADGPLHQWAALHAGIIDAIVPIAVQTRNVGTLSCPDRP